ncbi:MAG: serine hydrolase [Gemmatimonadetes bacterium]|nr:MAG: serine hydrolase [Gemmatimonadota bacterium]
MRSRISFFLCLVSMPAILSAQPAASRASPRLAPPDDWSAFLRLFDAYADSDRVVGASVLVMRDGRVLDRHDYGWADRAARQRVDARTIFHWGSITKTLTAIAIMQLHDRRQLSLDEKITRYVPELRQVHDSYGMIDSITLRMLLSHSAGFQNPTWPYTTGKAWEPFEPTTWSQLVAMMPYQELHFRPGSRYSYSNPGFIYLARVIEQLSGDAWQSYVQKNIFAPLELTHSYFGATPYHLAADRSNNYTIRRDSSGSVAEVANGRDFDPGITIPNGGWNAPLSDLARYATFLTGAVHDDSTRRRFDAVLSRTTLSSMWHPLHPMSETAAAPDSMALSFFVLHRGTATILGHTGSQAGFRSFIFFNPMTTSAVIAAFNSSNEAEPARAAYLRMYEAALALLR